MQINGLSGMLTEYGEVMGKRRAALTKAISEVLARVADRLVSLLIDTLPEWWAGSRRWTNRLLVSSGGSGNARQTPPQQLGERFAAWHRFAGFSQNAPGF